jgi:hypothetical protein
MNASEPDKLVQVRLPEGYFEKLRMLAEQAKTTPAITARMIICEYIDRDGKERGREVSIDPWNLESVAEAITQISFPDDHEKPVEFRRSITGFIRGVEEAIGRGDPEGLRVAMMRRVYQVLEDRGIAPDDPRYESEVAAARNLVDVVLAVAKARLAGYIAEEGA